MSDKLNKRLLKKSLAAIDVDDNKVFNIFRDKTEKIQNVILNLVYGAQAEAMRVGIENKKVISLPKIGTFKIKPTRLKSIEFSEMILEEYGLKHKSQLTDEQREEYEDRMAELMRKEILSRRLARNSDSNLIN